MVKRLSFFFFLGLIILGLFYLRSCLSRPIIDLDKSSLDTPRKIPVQDYTPSLLPFIRKEPPVASEELVPLIPKDIKTSFHVKYPGIEKEIVIVETKKGEYYSPAQKDIPGLEIKIYQWKRNPLEFPLFNRKLVFSQNYDFGTTTYFCIGFDLIRFRTLRFGADIGVSLLKDVLVAPCFRYEIGELDIFKKELFYFNINFGYNLISRRPVIGFSLTW